MYQGYQSRSVWNKVSYMLISQFLQNNGAALARFFHCTAEYLRLFGKVLHRHEWQIVGQFVLARRRRWTSRAVQWRTPTSTLASTSASDRCGRRRRWPSLAVWWRTPCRLTESWQHRWRASRIAIVHVSPRVLLRRQQRWARGPTRKHVQLSPFTFERMHIAAYWLRAS